MGVYATGYTGYALHPLQRNGSGVTALGYTLLTGYTRSLANTEKPSWELPGGLLQMGVLRLAWSLILLADQPLPTARSRPWKPSILGTWRQWRGAGHVPG